jgi:hypothetical protein
MTIPRPKDSPIEGAVAALIRRIAHGPAPRGETMPARIRTQERPGLEPAAIRLLEALPPYLRLVALRCEFPRLLNRLAADWNDPKAFEATIESLVLDHRGGRQGFPFAVLRELTELRDYHAATLRRARPRR